MTLISNPELHTPFLKNVPFTPPKECIDTVLNLGPRCRIAEDANCLGQCDEMFEHFPSCDETSRHKEFCHKCHLSNKAKSAKTFLTVYPRDETAERNNTKRFSH